MKFLTLGPKAIDITGQRFGRLVARGPVERRDLGYTSYVLWHCDCDCGGSTRTTSSKVRSGYSSSCGCYSAEQLAEGLISRKHGHARPNLGFSDEYKVWSSMLNRCRLSNEADFKNYAGRGITVCERWAKDFLAFYADMGLRPSPKHSIDRINNDGNYEPGNCRWATSSEQGNNRRVNAIIEAFGRKQTLAQWAREAGVPTSVLWTRLRRRASAEDAIKFVSQRPRRKAA